MPIGMQPTAPRRVDRLIINLDTTLPVVCGWDTCDRPARTSYRVRTHEHRTGLDCGHVDQAGGMLGRHAIYAFCSEGHLGYWVDSSGRRARELEARRNGKIYGNRLPGATGRRYA